MIKSTDGFAAIHIEAHERGECVFQDCSVWGNWRIPGEICYAPLL